MQTLKPAKCNSSDNIKVKNASAPQCGSNSSSIKSKEKSASHLSFSRKTTVSKEVISTKKNSVTQNINNIDSSTKQNINKKRKFSEAENSDDDYDFGDAASSNNGLEGTERVNNKTRISQCILIDDSSCD